MVLRSFTCLLFFFVVLSAHAQFYSDFEAKRFLRESGANYGDFIEDAESIVVYSYQIEGRGGMSIDLPILASVKEIT